MQRLRSQSSTPQNLEISSPSSKLALGPPNWVEREPPVFYDARELIPFSLTTLIDNPTFKILKVGLSNRILPLESPNHSSRDYIPEIVRVESFVFLDASGSEQSAFFALQLVDLGSNLSHPVLGFAPGADLA